jgi:hypothetical protein
MRRFLKSAAAAAAVIALALSLALGSVSDDAASSQPGDEVTLNATGKHIKGALLT